MEDQLEGIILDWAGTTLDYGCYAPAVVFVEIFNRAGVPISMEEARRPMGAHKRVHIQRITEIPDVKERWSTVNGKYPTEDDVDKLFKDFVPLQLECLADYADLIPGTLEAVKRFRAMGLKIGSTTGYLPDMMNILKSQAVWRGYIPDSSVCAGDVPEGRPAPWMCYRNAENLRIYPMHKLVKVGDTVPDILEGKNAGMWTIGLAKTGNEMGLNLEEVSELEREAPEKYKIRLERAYGRLRGAGANFVVDEIGNVPEVLVKINEMLRNPQNDYGLEEHFRMGS